MDKESNVLSWTTLGGYALLGALAFAVYYNYQHDRKKPVTTKVTGYSAKQNIGDDVASAAAAMKKKADRALKQKSKPKTSSTESAVPATSEFDSVASATAKRDESKADQDFAQSFSKMKSGHQFSATKAEKQRAKSVKQSRAQEVDKPAGNVSAPSSTTGDADDDLSPAVSPVPAAADSTGVSDMLEATGPGPSVLRLTDTDAVKSKPKKEKAPEVVESKKQRQNRQKAERKKLEREQDEAERKKLEEAQRRRARIAEGRPAKDGSAFVANHQNAWTEKTNGDKPVQPLDTFEQKPLVETTNRPAPKPATTNTKEQSGAWLSSLPSEEDQMAQVIEDSSSWNEVTSKKGKKGKKVADEPSAQPVKTADTSAAVTAASAVKAPVNGNSAKSKPALKSNSSFAALAPEETADEVEEEWEV